MKKKSGIVVLVLLIIALVVVCIYKLNGTDGNYRIGFQGTDSQVVEEWEIEEESVETVTQEDIDQAYLTPRVEVEGEPDDYPSEESTSSDKEDSTDDKSKDDTEHKNKTEDKDENKTEVKEETAETPSDSDTNKTEYEKYMDMSGEEQQKVFESYENPQDFFEWYNAAKAEYDEQNQAIIVDGGSINLEDYIGKQDE